MLVRMGKREEHLFTVGEKVTAQLLWKSVWKFFKKLKVELPFNVL
jgi:hypothetical protein